VGSSSSALLEDGFPAGRREARGLDHDGAGKELERAILGGHASVGMPRSISWQMSPSKSRSRPERAAKPSALRAFRTTLLTSLRLGVSLLGGVAGVAPMVGFSESLAQSGDL
jgi:hypothetical protein